MRGERREVRWVGMKDGRVWYEEIVSVTVYRRRDGSEFTHAIDRDTGRRVRVNIERNCITSQVQP